MVGIIPKPIIKPPLWQKSLLYFSLILLIGVISSYFILGHFQKKLTNEIKKIEQSMKEQETVEEVALEKNVLYEQKKIDDFSFILEKHHYPSHFFKFLEESALPEIRFINLNLSPNESKAVITGSAKNFNALGQQLFIFQEKKEVSQANLSDISIGEKGEVRFNLNLLLTPQLFQ